MLFLFLCSLFNFPLVFKDMPSMHIILWLLSGFQFSVKACSDTVPFSSVCLRPNLIDMSKVYRQTNLENLEQAFSVAERELGVTRLLDPEGKLRSFPEAEQFFTQPVSIWQAITLPVGTNSMIRKKLI